MAEDSKSILSILDNSRGYEVALLTTFNFEIEFFEKAVLSRLIKNEIRKVSVYIDSKELSKAIRKSSSTVLGQRYIVNPVEMHGSFHPKIILLLGEKKARIILGSGNLKTSGYYTNNEVFGCIDYTAGQPELRRIIYDAIRFFEECNQYTPHLDSDLLEGLRRLPYYRPFPENDRIRFIGNGTSSVLEQASKLITGNVQNIKIAVPYYDNGLKGLGAVRETWPGAGCELYLQHEWSTYQNSSQADLVEKVFEEIGSGDDNNNHFYHGKVFLFRSQDADYLLYGSSNCTQSALTMSKEEGGNYECDFLIKGSKGEYEGFFSQFIITDKQPEGHPMLHTSLDEGNFFFRYGVLEKKLILHIGFSQSFKRAIFSYRDTVIPWRRADGEILLEMDGDLVGDGTFSLNVEYDGQNEIINCWYIDRSAISLFRIQNSKAEELIDYADFGEGDKFQEDYEKLLRAMGSCRQDWAEMKQRIAPYLAAKEEEEGAEKAGQDDAEDEDFVVNVNLSDEDISAFRQYCTMERIRNKVTEKYLHSLPMFFREKEKSSSDVCKKGEEGKSGELHGHITQDKRFVRFIKRVVRNYTDPDNIEAVSGDHYAGIVAVVFSIFEEREDLFDKEYLIRTRCELILALITRLDADKDESRLWISKIIGILLYNHSVSETYENTDKKNECEQHNRRVLLAVERVYKIRNCYTDYIPAGDESSVSYIEQLFGYRDISQIEKSLRQQYGDLCGIRIDHGTAVVDIISETPEDFLKPDAGIVRELRRYSSNVQKLSSIVFTIRSPKKGENLSIVKIQHRINLQYCQWSHSILRANGQVQNYPSTFLHV